MIGPDTAATAHGQRVALGRGEQSLQSVDAENLSNLSPYTRTPVAITERQFRTVEFET